MSEGMYKYKDILDVVTKEILDEYLKGEKPLNELVDEAVSNFRDALLQAVNGFDKKGVEKKADMPSGEYAWCPVDPTKIKVRLFRNICQDWMEIPQCFHGLCGFFPVFDKTPVTNVKLKPKEKGVHDKKSSVDGVEEEVKKMIEELDKKGVVSMAEKFRLLRNSFLEKLGVDKLRHIIKSTIKKGSVDIIRRDNFRDDEWKVELYEMVKNNTVKKAKCIRVVGSVENMFESSIKGIKEFSDGSYVILVDDGKKERVVLPEHVVEIEKNY